MDPNQANIKSRLRIVGILIVLGLLVELFTLASNHPLGFLVFLGIGGVLIFAGVALYLWSLVPESSSHVARDAGQVKISSGAAGI